MASKQVSSEFGLLIIGNSGVGKSYLANLFLNSNHFSHEFSARSVTHRTDSRVCQLGSRLYRLYNIPGLIEGNRERMTLNREQIERAFTEQNHNPIVIVYVFGHQNGRIRHEDLVCFHLMNNAYQFSPNSLIAIVNGLPSDRPDNYNNQTQELLFDSTRMKPNRICFIDHFNAANFHEKSKFRQYLVDALDHTHPEIHNQTNQIDLIDDKIEDLRNHLDDLRFKINEERIDQQNTLMQMEQATCAQERLIVLRRLFFKVKVALLQLLALSKQEERLKLMIEQWNSREAETEKQENLSQQRWLNVSLNQYRKDIEQICYELKQIYEWEFNRQYDACREYFILLDDLRYDSSIEHVAENFLRDLLDFTRADLCEFD